MQNIHKQIVGKQTTDWEKDELLSYEKTIYDSTGRVSCSISLDEDGYEWPTSYEYDKASKQTVVIDPCGHDITHIYDSNLDVYRIDSFTLNGTHKTVTTYEGTRRKSITDANDNTTYFTYDALGRVIKTMYPPSKPGDPNTYLYTEYDSLGNKLWESKQTAKTFEQLTAEDIKLYEYDAAGHLTAVTLYEDDIESPAHDGSIITARPRYEYVYDEFSNLIEQWDNIYVQQSSIVDTYARLTKFTYDWLNNQTSRELPDGAKGYKQYDELSRIYYAKDFKGQITGYEYDSQGRLKYKRYYEDQYAYDTNDPAEIVQYYYDNLGRRTQTIDAEGTTYYEYDIEGNLLSVDSPQGTVNYDYSLITNRRLATWTDNTDTQYGYDELGRLSSVELLEVNGSSVSKLTTYEYTSVGSRSKMYLPNNAVTSYAYDSINRLLNITHEKAGPLQLSKYDYELKDDGMRTQLAEDISTGGGRTVGYTYDSLNRVVSESSSATSGVYGAEYTYDIVGNRTERLISANGQCMQTDYVYNDRDQLIKETHINPGTCFYLDGNPVYAYASNGRVSHYRLYGSAENINPFKAYLLGIPLVWSQIFFRAILLMVPIILLLPVFGDIYSRRRKRQIGGEINKLSIFKRILCVLLCYTVFFSTIGLEQLAQAAIDYSNLSTANWGTVNRDIHYYYDENGSCVEKIEAVKDEADPENNFIEKTIYEYNLQNRLSLVKTTTDGVNWDITTYKYNDDGIRVEKNNNGTVTTYLVDSHNHTGFSQVLEEWTDDVLIKTYIIGDDIIGEADNTGVLTYLLYDGQGSVRHHSDSDGDLIAYSGCDTFAYDAYGNRVDPLKDVVNDGLFYTGEMFDCESGQYYLRARYYNPLTGLFNRMDDFAGNYSDPQSLHKYLYCHNNPVNNIDPSGKFIGGISNVVASIAISAVMVNVGLTVYSGIRHKVGALGIAWQVIQNLAVFAVIAGAILLSGPVAVISGLALLITAIVGIVNIVRSWPGMDTIDKIIAGATIITFLAFAGAVRAGAAPKAPPPTTFEGDVCKLPESYFSNVIVDMRNASPRSGSSVTGTPRNLVYFWGKVKAAKPEYFSPDNLSAIQKGRAPTVNAQWIKYHPQHMSFKGCKLIHHHMGQSTYAVAVPEPIHLSWSKVLHPIKKSK